MSQEFNQAAPVSDGRGAAARNGGGTGAPPSNTAPDNSIPFFQPFRWGIDSLYLSYPGVLSEEWAYDLRNLKQQAQKPEYEASKAQFILGEHVFEVKDKSSGLFAFTLVDGAFNIRLSASRKKQLPMAYVQVSSGLLAHRTVEDIAEELHNLLARLGAIERPKVSRVDLFVDFTSSVDMEGWQREAWVTKAASVHQYAEGSTFTGWTIGAGGALMARLYLKSLEQQKSGKDYLLDLWREVGWDGKQSVWRLEFEFRREVLAELQLSSLPQVRGNLDGLWNYASTDWLKLCVPSPSDQTRSRWPIHPLWMALASIDWQSSGGPLSRTFSPTRAPSLEWLGARTLSLLASIASLQGHRDFESSYPHLLHQASNALSARYGLSGISLEQGFVEMVEARNRKFNTRANERDENEEPEEPRSQNPYYRAKQGL